MSALPRTTIQRLLALPQPGVDWEGDRLAVGLGLEGALSRDLLLWVDRDRNFVRHQDFIDAASGPEALVRGLLRAMETPNPGPGDLGLPYRPRRVFVRSHEQQLYLRGALQDLGITVAYAPELPILDNLFVDLSPLLLQPEVYRTPEFLRLEAVAQQIWKRQAWIWFEQAGLLEIRCPGLEDLTLYACSLGNSSGTRTLVLYRSLESLRRFRDQVQTAVTTAEQQEALTSQDCLFVDFQPRPDQRLPEIRCGSIHPLEGLQPIHEEELGTLILALRAVERFLGDRRCPGDPGLSAIELEFRIAADIHPRSPMLKTRVRTRPDLQRELVALPGTDGEMPPGSFVLRCWSQRHYR